MNNDPTPALSREAFDRARAESDKPTFHPWDDDPQEPTKAPHPGAFSMPQGATK